MTIHYHGGPHTPLSVLGTLHGANFCVSYAAPDQVARVHDLGQSVMLDNGAFSFWRTGRETDWPGYYSWAERWLSYPTSWAVIPDVIDGDTEANDALIAAWPFGVRGAPVWHMHEPISRLLTLAQDWSRVCLGSSAEYAVIGTDRWHRRMESVMNALCGNGPVPVWLHMLRGMSLSGSQYPFASVDSTDVAQNHSRPRNTARRMVERWDALQNPAVWRVREQLELVA